MTMRIEDCRNLTASDVVRVRWPLSNTGDESKRVMVECVKANSIGGYVARTNGVGEYTGEWGTSLRFFGFDQVLELVSTPPFTDTLASSMGPIDRIGKHLVHPAARRYRPLTPQEYATLRESIWSRHCAGQEPLLQPISLLDGQIIDGVHRAKVCAEFGIEPWVIDVEGEPGEIASSANCARRHMGEQELALMMASRARLERGTNRFEAKAAPAVDTAVAVSTDPDEVDWTSIDTIQRGPAAPRTYAGITCDGRCDGCSRPPSRCPDTLEAAAENTKKWLAAQQAPPITEKQAASEAGCSVDTIQRAKVVLEHGVPELVQAVKDEQVSIGAAAQVATLPVEDQVAVVAEGPKAVQEAAKAVREGKTPHVAKATGNFERYTPPRIMDRVREVLGEIELDPCSCSKANETVQADRYYTAEDDGLQQPWIAKTLWMNPPFARALVELFTEKFVDSCTRGDVEEAICLVNNATETRWFQYLLDYAAALCLPYGRIEFLDEGGLPVRNKDGTLGTPLQGQALLYFGERADVFHRVFDVIGVVLQPMR